jgi:acetyl-CoA/propionyl-CoA carboxylase carboxyl transferase subunit
MQVSQHNYYAETEIDFRTPEVRLSKLLDPPFSIPDYSAGECGVEVASGFISGIPVVAYCTDARKMAGSLGLAGAQHISKAIDLARERGCPVIGIWHSGGAKLAEGVRSMHGVGCMFAAMTRASGVIPQISVVLGPAAGAAAYGPALTDIVIMSDQGRLFVTGPDVVRSVTGEVVDMEALGGRDAHGRKSGVAHITVNDEMEAFARARMLTELLGRPGSYDLGAVGQEVDLRTLLPSSPRRAYDVHPIVTAILDQGDGGPAFQELQPRWAANIVIGLGRIVGRTVGVIANNPLRKGGCLDSLSAEKASRFVRMCDSLGIPLIVVVDVPGYLPGVGQEWDGVVRRGAKLLHAFAEAVVPRVTLITRKAYGGAYIAMNSRSLGATTVFAWPEAQVAVMGAEAAVGILHRKKLAAATEAARPELLAELIEEHLRTDDIKEAMDIGVVDDVISPQSTRYRIAAALATATSHRGGHGNIPL